MSIGIAAVDSFQLCKQVLVAQLGAHNCDHPSENLRVAQKKTFSISSVYIIPCPCYISNVSLLIKHFL